MDLRDDFCAQFREIFLISFQIGKRLAKLAGRLSVLSDCLKNLLNFLPHARLLLLKSFVTFDKLLVKRAGKFGKFILVSSNLFVKSLNFDIVFI